MGALLDGVYVGDVTIAEILRHGDFGLGTFNHLDGEMVILDGVCYHLHADGSTTVAADSERTPFAAVTRFRTDLTFEITESTNRVDAVAQIDSLIGSENLMYAIRINGGFGEMRTRTVMAQSPPYPPLIKATESQAETRFTDVTGALAGFRLPYYDQGISVAGYHLHFLDENRNQGGHALDFQLSHGTVSVCTLSDLHLSLPGTPEFLGAISRRRTRTSRSAKPREATSCRARTLTPVSVSRRCHKSEQLQRTTMGSAARTCFR
jgi:acetolactate decarboxylase